MKSGEYGTEAVAVNAAIIEQAPRNVSAWVRMGRCHLEQRQWDEAVSALRAALQISPTHTVATNLLNEVRKRRALAPTAVQRTMTGFGAREFALVEALPAADAAAALKPRIEALFDAVNQTSIAAKIVEARQRSGESGTKLFHANSFVANEQRPCERVPPRGPLGATVQSGLVQRAAACLQLHADRSGIQSVGRRA